MVERKLVEEVRTLRSRLAKLEHGQAGRETAEQALRRIEKQASTEIEAARSITFNYHIATGKVKWSGAIEAITGYAPEEFAQVDVDGWAKMIHPDDRDRFLSILQKATDQLDRATAEYRFRTKNGVYVTLCSISLTEKEDGKAVRLVGIFQDITERKKAEEALKSERDKLQSIMDALVSAKVGIDIIGSDYRVLFQNQTLKEQFGDLTGKLCYENYMGLKKPCDFCSMIKAIENGMVDRVELTGADGKDYELISVPLANPDGTIDKVVEAVMDITERKRAEEALVEEHNLLRTLIDNVPDYIYVKDTESRFTTCNIAVARRSMGVTTPNEVIGKTDFDFSPRELAEQYYADEQEVIRTGRALVNKEESGLDQAGNMSCILTTKLPLRDGQGKIVGIVGIGRDITERKRADEALRESQGKVNAMLQSIGDHISMMDKELNIIWANNTAKEIFGEDIIGKKCYEIYHRRKEPCEPYPCLTLKAFADGKVHEHDTHVIDKNGKIIYFHCTANVALRDQEGNPTGVLEISRDTTERKEAEEALRESEAKYRTLADNSLTGIFINQDGQLVFVNDRFAEMHGYTTTELLGKEYWTLIPLDDREKVAEIVSKRLAGEEITGRYETRKLKKDGQILWCEMMASRIEYMGRPAIMGNVVDITERKRAEKEARQARAELEHSARLITVGEMASVLAHEVNQPLCAIANYADACLRMTKDTEPQSGKIAGAIEQIAIQADRAGRIIGHIRNLVGKRKPHRSSLDVNETVREVIDMEETEAGQKGVTIRMGLGKDMPLVLADRIEIEQVILNLVRNGFEAMSGTEVKRRKMTIETSTTGSDSVEVVVRDTGRGLPAEGAEKIFDSFFTTKPGGLGIGLPLSRSIVEAHGGRLWAEPNRACGASFRFTLPVKGA